MTRTAEFSRVTSETDITVSIDLDNPAEVSIETGVGFLTICLQLLLDTDVLD